MSGPRRLAEFAKLRKQVASETVSHGICIAVRIRNSFLLESATPLVLVGFQEILLCRSVLGRFTTRWMLSFRERLSCSRGCS
jgi:hypothetical protein